MGRTPGFLSRVIRWLESRGYKPTGSIYSVHRRYPKEDSAAQRSLEDKRKERFQAAASSPEEPDEPSIFSAVE